MIHRFNEMGMRSLDPQWAGGRPRQITTDDERFIIETAATRPEKLGQPFTRWSIRKLVDFLAQNEIRVITIGRKRLRQLLVANDITFQRTKTWKESNDPDRDAKLDRIDHVLEHHPDRTFAFDEFGPLAIRPVGGSCWAPSRAATTPASELPQAPRGAAVPRLLLPSMGPPRITRS
jgi:transposase